VKCGSAVSDAGSNSDGEAGRLDTGDAIDDKGSKQLDCVPAAIRSGPSVSDGYKSTCRRASV
jgi:hypothetical protein